MCLVNCDTKIINGHTVAGRYCEWEHKGTDQSKESETFEAYKETLVKKCDPGEPALLTWTVSQDTPDTVYYQVCLISVHIFLSIFFVFNFLFFFVHSATRTTTSVGRSTLWIRAGRDAISTRREVQAHSPRQH